MVPPAGISQRLEERCRNPCRTETVDEQGHVHPSGSRCDKRIANLGSARVVLEHVHAECDAVARTGYQVQYGLQPNIRRMQDVELVPRDIEPFSGQSQLVFCILHNWQIGRQGQRRNLPARVW